MTYAIAASADPRDRLIRAVRRRLLGRATLKGGVKMLRYKLTVIGAALAAAIVAGASWSS